MKRVQFVRLCVWACSLILLSLPGAVIAQCGGERWNVKTGLDNDVSQVNLSSVTPTSIDSMIALPKPSKLPDNNRVKPTEITTWSLSGTLIKYVKSYDNDYHIVFQDSSGRTMIGEIPDPNCLSVSSRFRSGVVHARAQFDSMFTAATTFKTANVPVVITGVGFFDYNEGQEGIAPNGVELHPIIDISFGGTFSLNSSSSSVTAVQGDNATFTVNSVLSGGFNAQLTFSSTGLPSGVTAMFDPQAFAAPGSGTTTVTLDSSPNTPTGQYSVTVSATGGGQTRSTTVSFTILSSGGGTQQQLGNPGFENGSTNAAPWTATAGVIDGSTVELSHSGSWKAWLDGFGTAHTDTLLQQTNIPAAVTSATLSFWLHVGTAETTTTTANDTLKIQLRNSAGTVLSTLATYSNLNAAPGYSQLSFDVFAYRGQTIQVYLIGVENSSAKTSFVVDDFSLNVSTSVVTNPNLAISASPSSLSVPQGASATSTIASAISGGFNSSVSLSASGVPAGTSSAFNPSVIGTPGNGSSTLMISATTSTPAGTYPITITASGGGLTRTANMSLTITAPSGGTTTQLIGNPGFENGSSAPSPWVVTTGVINNSSANEAPHSGTWKAWLNGYGTAHTDTLYQQVTIAPNATAANLTFWRHIDTAETTTASVYDTVKLQVRNASGAVLATLATYSNLSAATGYSQVSFDLLPYRGQTIQIYFVGVEDSSLKTSFVFDDFVLNVTTP